MSIWYRQGGMLRSGMERIGCVSVILRYFLTLYGDSVWKTVLISFVICAVFRLARVAIAGVHCKAIFSDC